MGKAWRKVDLLFIDGDHSYLGVKADYENYKQFVREGGFIAFHNHNEKYPDIDRFFNELQGQKDSFTAKNGIGFIAEDISLNLLRTCGTPIFSA